MMEMLRNERKSALFSIETQEEHPRNGQSRITSIPGSNEKNITQVSKEVEGSVTKELSQRSSWTDSRILGALSKLDKFLLNPRIRTPSGTVPKTSRNTDFENQQPTVDCSQNELHLQWTPLAVSPALKLTRTNERPLAL